MTFKNTSFVMALTKPTGQDSKRFIQRNIETFIAQETLMKF